jgi:hypothetical protein
MADGHTSANMTPARGIPHDRRKDDTSGQPTQSEAPMNTRQTDPAPSGMKITREIPLWGIITVVGSLVAQGVSTHFGQIRLVENMERLSVQVEKMASEVNGLSRTQVGLELQMQELRRRVELMETQQRSMLAANSARR